MMAHIYKETNKQKPYRQKKNNNEMESNTIKVTKNKKLRKHYKQAGILSKSSKNVIKKENREHTHQ